MNYPEILKIEITNHCNAKCVFCNNDKIENKQNMPLWMFEKILSSFPSARQVQPQWFGEPMMHPDFDKIIDICKKHNKEVVFYTNGSLVDKHLTSLKKLTKKDRIIISLEGADKKTYESLRCGLSWEKLLSNMKLLKKVPARKNIRMTVCKENRNHIKKDISYWKEKTRWKIITVNEKPLVDNRIQTGDYIKHECKQPTNNFTVSVDGKIKLCCIDYNNQVDLGKIEKSTDLKKLWMKTKNKRHCGYPICGKCLFEFEEL